MEMECGNAPNELERDKAEQQNEKKKACCAEANKSEKEDSVLDGDLASRQCRLTLISKRVGVMTAIVRQDVVKRLKR